MKKALDINEQMQRLKERGMLFDDESKAKEILLDVGFYRLGFYSFPFEQSYPSLDNRTHKLQSGTTFKAVYDLYEFDRQLRRILLNALDRIEVNVRTKITYIVSNHYKQSPTWFADKTIMEIAYVDSFKSKVYDTILGNDVIKRHHAKHINDKFAPAWKTIEFMTLGNIGCLYSAIKDQALKRRIANEYGCSLGVFLNYLETIRIIRNKCAHGNCIYSINFHNGIKAKPAGIIPDCRHNISGAISVILYLLGCISINRRNELESSIRSLLDENKASQTNKIIQECTKISL